MKIKTIDINALEWRDKVNGNSYCAGTVSINYGMPDVQNFVFPFQYGYGDFYLQAAKELLEQKKVITLPKYPNGNSGSLWEYCEKHKIIVRNSIIRGCKKSELKNIA